MQSRVVSEHLIVQRLGIGQQGQEDKKRAEDQRSKGVCSFPSVPPVICPVIIIHGPSLPLPPDVADRPGERVDYANVQLGDLTG
jgi:hypothetical protein